MEKKIIVPLVVVFIISLLIGVGIGQNSEKGVWQTKLAQTQQELDWLKLQLGMFYPPLPEKIYSFSGTIAEKGDKFLVMETQIQVSQFPLPEGKEFEKQNIKVNMTEETEISRFEIIAEPSSLEGLPSEPFKKVILGFGDIKTGDQITVISGENVRGKKEITAQKIQIGY